MKYLLLALLFTGCAQHQWVENKDPAKQKLALAHNDCTLKAEIAVKKQSKFDWGYGGRFNGFMKECMSGQGYEFK